MTGRLLCIGGLDSSGGAGLLRDAATAAEFGVACAAAATAITAQSDRAVTAVHPVPPDQVAAQIRAAAEAGIGAVKIGMLGWAATVEAVAAALPEAPLVLDPVLAASSGRSLLDAAGLQALLARLLPRAALVTPNLPELARLAAALGLDPAAGEAEAVAALRARGAAAVLVKGGHAAPGDGCEDRLHLGPGHVIAFAGPRFAGTLRGTGCQLASAIAAGLARGADLPAAVAAARAAVERRFRAAQPAGQSST